MDRKEKLAMLGNAYVTKKVEDARESIRVFNDTLPADFIEGMKKVQFTLNEDTGTFELDYDIMSTACSILSDNCDTIEALEAADMYDLSTDSASVYTAARLSYLNVHNESDVSEILKEYGCDIQTAAAIWYEQQVAHACELIREFILAV